MAQRNLFTHDLSDGSGAQDEMATEELKPIYSLQINAHRKIINDTIAISIVTNTSVKTDRATQANGL